MHAQSTPHISTGRQQLRPRLPVQLLLPLEPLSVQLHALLEAVCRLSRVVLLLAIDLSRTANMSSRSRPVADDNQLLALAIA